MDFGSQHSLAVSVVMFQLTSGPAKGEEFNARRVMTKKHEYEDDPLGRVTRYMLNIIIVRSMMTGFMNVMKMREASAHLRDCGPLQNSSWDSTNCRSCISTLGMYRFIYSRPAYPH